MRSSFRFATIAVAAALFAGCTDSTAPDGRPTTLAARAYVDADGSGGYTTGDVPIVGATLTLNDPAGTAVASAATGADGSVTFDGVRPGSYTLRITGPVPAGAVLATASAPVVTAGADGGERSAEFRYVFHPGGVEGTVFRDDDGSGVYDPGADIPASGIQVRLVRAGVAVDSTFTDEDGAFAFGVVRPGAYTLEFEAIPGVTYAGGASQPITVTSGGSLSLNVLFTGDLTLTVAQAKSRADGARVRVVGVVTAAQGSLRNDNAYIQDASGGVQVFGIAGGTPLAVGDSVAVSGELEFFFGEAEIITPTVERLGTGQVPAVRELTGTQVVARGFEGSLVRVDSLTVLSVPTSGTNYNLAVRAPDGSEFQVRVEGPGAPNIPLAYWTVGEKYDVTGVLGSRNGVAQLKTRGPNDVSLAGQPTIGQARGFAVGTEVAVVGVVTVPQGAFRTDNAYIQDATGGILLFGVPVETALVLGEQVLVRGRIDVFNGEVEIVSPVVTRLGTAAVPAPRVVTGAQLAARTYEGQLARINGATVTAVGGGTSPAYNVTLSAPDGTSFVMRVEGASGITRAMVPVGSTFDIVGALSVFNAAAQIKPRNAADLIAR